MWTNLELITLVPISNRQSSLISTGQYFDFNDIFRTHPIEALRVKALEIFYKSDVYSQVVGNGRTYSYIQEKFLNELFKIVPLGFVLKGLEMEYLEDVNFTVFLCLAVYSIIVVDEKMTREESAFFKKNLIRYVFPNSQASDILDSLHFEKMSQIERENVMRQYGEKMKSLPEIKKRVIIDQMIQAVKSDKKVLLEEINLLFTIASYFDATIIAEREVENQFGWKLKFNKSLNSVSYQM
ncbi:MAG: hypothetical protein N3A69_15740 [Leptospiraceae bacterium]|nr:hypothetical protein [Leptospiraceae bacterium]